MSEDERRRDLRLGAVVVVQLDEHGRYGTTRDISERGLLVATRAELEVGDRLEVTIRVKSSSWKRSARVVRIEKAPPDQEWPYRAALELDEAFPEDAVAEGTRAAAAFLSKNAR